MAYRTSLTAPVFGLRREIDRLFEDAFGGGGGRAGWSPAVDVREDRDALTFEVELPGLKPSEVEVICENGVLTVRGEKTSERKENEEGRYHLVERTYGSFSRSFQLPQGVDDSKIEADFENGVLRVRVPKTALPQPRKIEVKGTSESSKVQSGSARRQGSESTRSSANREPAQTK
jgi:HSP20 family protein